MTLKLACFDLDDTIINGHLHRALEAKGIVPGQATPEIIRQTVQEIGGVKNPRALKATLRALLRNGVHVAVTSYTGYPETIPVVLEMVGLSPQEIAQVNVASFAPPRMANGQKTDGYGKNHHIQAAIEAFGGNIRPDEVVLIDDRIDHYELAKAKGYNVIWVQGSEGNIGYLNELRELAGLSQVVVYPAAVMEIPNGVPQPSWVDKLLSWVGLQRIPHGPSR